MVLYVVGSLRVTCGEYVSYLQGLRDMAGEASNIQIIEKYLSDEEFDTWINSCDVIITPYREIWSSGIIARAKLFEIYYKGNYHITNDDLSIGLALGWIELTEEPKASFGALISMIKK